MKKQTKKGNIDGKKIKKEKHREKDPKRLQNGPTDKERTSQNKNGQNKIRTDKLGE